MSEVQGACKDTALQLVTCMEARSPCVKAGGTVGDCLKQEGAMEGCEVSRTGRGVIEEGRGVAAVPAS
jgi:hypothetical protein